MQTVMESTLKIMNHLLSMYKLLSEGLLLKEILAF